MNANEYFLVSKMVEHLNVVTQYSRILHDQTYERIFKQDGWSLDTDLEDARRNMIALLEEYQSEENVRFAAGLDLATVVRPFISVEELGQIISNAKG